MKKLFLALALLMVGMFLASPGALAVTYPSCSQGGSIANGTTKDRFFVTGWCVDGYGVLTPQTNIATSSTQPNAKGGIAYPVNYNTTNMVGGSSPTYDSLIQQQTGNEFVDGSSGSVYILPTATVGEQFNFTVSTNKTITIDTLATTDTIMNKTPVTAGDGLKNSSATTADSVTLTCATAGVWAVTDYTGTWIDSGKTRG